MSLPADPLGAIERALISEVVGSLIRHDLRNKLSSIRNANFYLTRRVQKTELWASDPRTPQFFQLIEQLVADADQMLDARLSTARLGLRRVEPISARACVERAIACARIPDNPVELEWQEGDAELYVDGAELATALRAVIENAGEAMPGGAVVRVRAGPAPGSVPRFGFEVEDTGPGIGQGAEEMLFVPLQTTKPGHTGLGLSIARRVIQGYKGELAFRAQAVGACVSIDLPTHVVGARGA